MRDFIIDGNHTWERTPAYHRCPKCGKINESFASWEKRLDKRQKDLDCSRCGHSFTVTKKVGGAV